MRDSELAIGFVVLLLVIGGLIYFKFPEQVRRLLRGPSPADIYQSIANEADLFENESKTIISYLSDSWTIKPYRIIDAALKRRQYATRTQELKAERDSLIKNTLQEAEKRVSAANSVALNLQAIKASRARMNAPSLDNQIAALQEQLNRESDALSQILLQFSAERRSLNQKALRYWFAHSMLTSLLLALFLGAAYSFITRSPTPAPTQHPSPYRAAETPRKSLFSLFRPKPSQQSPLIQAAHGPILTDSAFRSTIEPKTQTPPQILASILKALPGTKTASKLASILAAYPDIPASRSHHLSGPGGLILHTTKALAHSAPLLTMLPDPKIGPVAILAHDIGKIVTFSKQGGSRPHDIASADIVASIPTVREEFDETTLRSLLLAIRHQHSSAEIPVNAPPLAHTILQFIKKADFAAVAEETREAAEKIKGATQEIIKSFPFLIPDLNVNGCNGGSPEGFVSDGYILLLKEPIKAKLLKCLNSPDAPVFKGQDPVWNEIAQVLANANLIATKIGPKQAGTRSCLFTIKTASGQEKAIALPASNIVAPLREKWLSGNMTEIEIL
jgi:hypothetical protein